MSKKKAIALFETPKALAEALGITPQAISQWPDTLSQRLTDEIIGAALRTGRITPKQALKISLR